MAYTKTQWNPGGPPGISAENLNKIEQGIADAHDMIETHINAAAPHSGHETPAGAQEKANAALEAANNYTDQAVSIVRQDLMSHKNDIMPHKFTDGAKTYRWGFRIVNGQPQFIYEEVSE